MKAERAGTNKNPSESNLPKQAYHTHMQVYMTQPILLAVSQQQEPAHAVSDLTSVPTPTSGAVSCQCCAGLQLSRSGTKMGHWM
jgi:hypothetical protein